MSDIKIKSKKMGIIIVVLLIAVVGIAAVALLGGGSDAGEKNNEYGGDKVAGKQHEAKFEDPNNNHNHKWVPIKETISRTQKEIVGTVNICTLCQREINGDVTKHLSQHEAKGEKAEIIKKPKYEKKVIEKEIIIRYECSCGAVKK